MSASKAQEYSKSYGKWCYEEGIDKEVIRNGFWYEICHELADKYRGCGNTDFKCLA
jgi:hypothetical protein